MRNVVQTHFGNPTFVLAQPLVSIISAKTWNLLKAKEIFYVCRKMNSVEIEITSRDTKTMNVIGQLP